MKKSPLASASAVRLFGTATIIAATIIAAAVGSVAAQAPLPERALSFEIGEERRYRIGPQESLGMGESAEWTIALREVIEERGEYIANFEFSHERFERIPGSLSANDFMIVTVEGRLRTNLAGFPLWLEFTQDFEVDQSEAFDNARRSIRYVYDGDGDFRKFIKQGRTEWDFKVGIPKYDYMDFDAPRGLYIFIPTALDCLGTGRVTCVDDEPAFANPDS